MCTLLSTRFIFKLPQLPAGHKTAELPIYSGKIMVYGSNGEQLSVPYYGKFIANMVFWAQSLVLIRSNG